MNFNHLIALASFASLAHAGSVYSEVKGTVGPNVEVVGQDKLLFIKNGSMMHYYKGYKVGDLSTGGGGAGDTDLSKINDHFAPTQGKEVAVVKEIYKQVLHT